MSGGGALAVSELADIEQVGQQGEVAIYTATDTRLDRRVTVKVGNPLDGEADVQRFDRETKLLGRLSAHPNVATVFSAGITPGREPYLVMELIDGHDLARHLELNGPFAWYEASEVSLQICDGLRQAHESGVLHRDLRPENVMMAGASPRLTGFGVTALAGPGATDLVGAVHAAPEAFARRWDERTDLYAVASTLYQMIDGRAPFWRPGADSIDALQLRLSHEPAPDLDPERGPEALNVFVKAALSKDPIDRPQTAEEFAHELRVVMRRHGADTPQSVLHATTSTMPIAVPTAVAAGVASAGVGAMAATHAVPAISAPPPDIAGASLEAPPALVPAALSGSTIVEPSAPATVVTDGPLATDFAAVGGIAAPGAFSDVSAEPDFVAPFADIPADDPAGPGDRPAPTGATPIADGTSVYGIFQPQPAGPGAEPPRGPQGDNPAPRRSPAFVVAVAMITVGVLGLGAVLAVSRFRSDDPGEAAPLLPAVTDPSSIEAGGDGEDTPGDGDGAGEAMVDGAEVTSTTEAAADEMDSTTTTVALVTVPDLVGLNVDAASTRLANAGLGVNVVGRTVPGARAGTVIQQKPEGGDLVTVPLSVTIYIPRATTLPPMAGKTAVAVCAELKALGAQCVQTLRHDAQIPVGVVVSTNPAQGAEFSEGSTVQMVVSKGPVVNVAVPEVANLTREAAQLALGDAGLSEISFEMEPSDAVENGRVTRTNPAAGTNLASDQPIVVYLSSGAPTKVIVPDVMGRTEAEATTLMTQAGLTVTIVTQDLPTGDGGIGKVVAIGPAAGTEVNSGSAVTLTIGKDMATTDPNPTTTTTVAESSE